MCPIHFDEKTITDPIHGSIGLSRLEQSIINTRTFQRLKKISQLGLANLVFPGAEHSRFAHSIGVMHLMSRMVDKLKQEECSHLQDDSNYNHVKQKLRLAALLHDIGHYPLAHSGEQVFQWIDIENNPSQITELSPIKPTRSRFLQEAAQSHSSGAAKHERLGELILTHEESEIGKILKAASYDPFEIARIVNGEDYENPFHVQLLSSTLDCDRMDFLVRDSAASGTYYGRVDIDYIVRSLTWDNESNFVCFYPKAINAIEHFVSSRFFSYNIIFHKTVMGFEIMARALFYAMMRDDELVSREYGQIVRSKEDVEYKISSDFPFLANFTDEYFWYYLELWRPSFPLLRLLRYMLLRRIPLRCIYESRLYFDSQSGFNHTEYHFLKNHLAKDEAWNAVLEQNGISPFRLAIQSKTVRFESIPFSVRYDKSIDDHERMKLIKIKTKDGVKDLISLDSSIVKVLCANELGIARLYALVSKDSNIERILIEESEKSLKRFRASA